MAFSSREMEESARGHTKFGEDKEQQESVGGEVNGPSLPGDSFVTAIQFNSAPAFQPRLAPPGHRPG